MKAIKIPLKDIVRAGYTVEEMLDGGISPVDLLFAGVSAVDFKAARINVAYLRHNAGKTRNVIFSMLKNGFTLEELTEAWYCMEDIWFDVWSTLTRTSTRPVTTEQYREWGKATFKKALQAKDVGTSKMMVRCLPDLSSWVLDTAITSGSFEIVRFIVELGVSEDTRNKAVLKACECGYLDVVKLLVEAPATASDEDEIGSDTVDTAVLIALKRGHTDIVEFFVEKGISEDAKKEMKLFERKVELLRVSELGHLDKVRCSVEQGVSEDARDDALSKAVDNIEVVKYLVDHGVSEDAKDKALLTAFERMSDFEAASSFKGRKEGWVFTRGTKGLGYYREKERYLSVVKFLVEKGISEGARKEAIVRASLGGHRGLVTFLVENGISEGTRKDASKDY